VARFSEEDKETIWDMREAGVPVTRIAKPLGRQNSSLRKFIATTGGRRPTARERRALRLSPPNSARRRRGCSRHQCTATLPGMSPRAGDR
jgi:transposase-like protein